jgi:cyclomaltodextrinase
MYQILGREKLNKNRYGKYFVKFETRWPRNTKHLYLVSIFTSYFPGRLEMKKYKDKAKITVRLKEGIYPYLFYNDKFEAYLDLDNPIKEKLTFESKEIDLSVAEIGIDNLRNAYEDGGFHPNLIIHDERDPAFISYFLNSTIIRLTSVKGEIKEIYVEYDQNGDIKKFQMQKLFNDDYRDYYQAVINGYISKYRFLLNVGTSRYYFGLGGLNDTKFIIADPLGLKNQEWWLGCIYYLIFPDSFDSVNHAYNFFVNAKEIPRKHIYLGGDLKGILKRLNYLKEQGIEAIYLTPIYKAMSYHRYDVIDHFEIDNYLGELEDFLNLVKNAHSYSIKIILDLVIHHSSPKSPMFLDLIKNKHSKYRSWYRLRKDPHKLTHDLLVNFLEFLQTGKLNDRLLKEKPFYEAFASSWKMPKFNHNNPEVLDYFKSIVSFWLKKGIDGFRVDVAHAIPDNFLREIYKEIKNHGNDKIMILEINYGLEYYPLGKISDSAMNYDLRKLILDFFLYKKISAYTFSEKIMQQYFSLPIFVANSLYNLLGSHDTARIVTLAKNLREVLFNMYAFLFACYGSPSIYYGDEIGMEGDKDPDCRRAMIWDEIQWNKELLFFIKQLISLRKKLKVLRLGFFKCEAINENTIRIIRNYDNEEFIAFFNRNIDQPLKIDLDSNYLELFNNKLSSSFYLKNFIYLYKLNN